MAIRLYTPSDVRLDPSGLLLREIPDRSPQNVAPGGSTESSGTGFDHTTIFYDVVLSARRDEVFAIGPPLLNLEDALLPAEFALLDREGQQLAGLAPKRDDRSHYSLVRFPIPRHVRKRIDRHVQFQIRFADGLTFVVRPNRADDSEVVLSLSTLQKDEPLLWVRQWIAYWQSLGVNRVIIYDNGSTYFSEMAVALGDLGNELDIVIVRWHFEYGPSHSFDYQYAQWASLNHARLTFPGAKWGAAFDIDEYPVLPPGNQIPDYLGQLKWRVALVLLKVFDVRNIGWSPKDVVDLPTAGDFVFRDKLPRKTFKYFYRTSRTKANGVHSAVVRPFRPVVAQTDQVAYFHYWALTRGWRHPERLEATTFDRSLHVRDTSVVDRLMEVGLSGGVGDP